jgi:predicted NBD/HSP70 family sugar kinase
VGVSLPGLIDRENGLLLSSTNMPRWRNVPIASILARELGLPVRVERSAHLAALYEKWVRPNPQRTTLIISLRTGIGMSLMHRGEIYRSTQGFDGEIGHTVVDLNGGRCECGGRGCLETFVSASAVCQRARAAISKGKCISLEQQLENGELLRPELIYRLAKEGDADCAEIVSDVGRYIGIAVANMINLFAPDDVVICGSIDTADELILEAVTRQIAQTVLPKMREAVTVCLARAKEKSPLMGAAVLVAQELFELPKLKPLLDSSLVVVP